MVAAEGSHAIALAGDAALPDFAEDAVQKTMNAFGRIDILVNNAGVQYLHDSIRNITAKQLSDTFAVNVYSAFFMTQAVLRHMSRGGAIINTSSVAAYKGRSDMLDYAAAKGALISFTYSLAQSPEVLEKNIRVNAVAPGHTISPMVEATYSGAHLVGAVRRGGDCAGLTRPQPAAQATRSAASARTRPWAVRHSRRRLRRRTSSSPPTSTRRS